MPLLRRDRRIRTGVQDGAALSSATSHACSAAPSNPPDRAPENARPAGSGVKGQQRQAHDDHDGRRDEHHPEATVAAAQQPQLQQGRTHPGHPETKQFHHGRSISGPADQVRGVENAGKRLGIAGNPDVVKPVTHREVYGTDSGTVSWQQASHKEKKNPHGLHRQHLPQPHGPRRA